MTPSTAEWLATRRTAVLVTVRADGSPQTSNVVFAYDGVVARVSVTADRAKTRNLQRDPRGVLHVLGEEFGAYASVSVAAALGPVSTSPGDVAGVELLALYEAVAGAQHPDPQDFYQAMVDERRLVLTLTPTSAVAWGLS